MSAAANAGLIAARAAGLRPRAAIVLGSGLGGFVETVAQPVAIPYGELAGFPAATVSGHAGRLVLGMVAGVPVAVLCGRVHYYESGRADGMRPALETLAALGVGTLLLTNAAGSLDPSMPPGSVMMITDHINLTGINPLLGEASEERFVGLTAAYDADLQERAWLAAEAVGEHLFRGVYMWFSGPSFETPAEIRAARILGADAVGMSTVPETILARFLGMRVAAFSVVTNLAAGLTGAELSHRETKERAPEGGARLGRILERLLQDLPHE